jgi:hypothetical protein
MVPPALKRFVLSVLPHYLGIRAMSTLSSKMLWIESHTYIAHSGSSGHLSLDSYLVYEQL